MKAHIWPIFRDIIKILGIVIISCVIFQLYRNYDISVKPSANNKEWHDQFYYHCVVDNKEPIGMIKIQNNFSTTPQTQRAIYVDKEGKEFPATSELDWSGIYFTSTIANNQKLTFDTYKHRSCSFHITSDDATDSTEYPETIAEGDGCLAASPNSKLDDFDLMLCKLKSKRLEKSDS